MKRILFFLILLNLFACDYFDKKKVYTEDILEEELQTFNWNEVDEYPAFETCESASGKEDKKKCFETTLRSILNSNLSKHHIIVSEDINDTLQLNITIDNQGKFTINNIASKATTKALIPDLDSLLRHSLDSLPKIYPAIKRSQQVKTQFVLPVIITIN
ncbi:hypothetical protein SAMN04515667_0839 [Formosa sp. Hel1_31_208]|uniref:hypothetical protein n=1 Tax=Formosa sp. Hel1_31_208 TaxID=1798225 RepID=UPI00087DB88B|nr:hypothetical protein [Formosa sp. Hel1_31_208]SDR85575.1 hypothetical protein SAMN04515667_0839 [Formosa sp. Hel1_31_208]